MKEGQYIQHRTRSSEWGIGCVLHREGDRAQVQFAHGLVVLDLRVAIPLYEQVSKPDAAVLASLNTPVKATRRRSAKAKA